MKRFFIFLFFTFFFVLFLNTSAFSSVAVFNKIQGSSFLRNEIKSLISKTIIDYFSFSFQPLNSSEMNRLNIEAKKREQQFLEKSRASLFITLKKEGKTIGCMGSLQPQKANLIEEIRHNLILALGKDPRHVPVLKDQIRGVEVFLSFTGKPAKVSSIHEINLMREGVKIKRGRKEAISLPGEAKTARYLLAFLRSKSGIQKNEVFEIYRFPVFILSFKPVL